MKIKQFKKQVKNEEYIIPNVLDKTSEYAKTKVYTSSELNSSKKPRLAISNRLVFKYAFVFVLILSIVFISITNGIISNKSQSPGPSNPDETNSPQSPPQDGDPIIDQTKPGDSSSTPIDPSSTSEAKPGGPGYDVADSCPGECSNYSYNSYVFYNAKTNDKEQINIQGAYEKFHYNELMVNNESTNINKIKILTAEQFCFVVECYLNHCSLEETIQKAQSKYNIPNEYVFMINDAYKYLNK